MTIGGGVDSQEPGGATKIGLLGVALAVGEGESASTNAPGVGRQSNFGCGALHNPDA
jgi:hypothetical protein